jgi:hypothetical protein
VTPLEDHEERIRRLEDSRLEHGERIRILEVMMERVITLTDIVVQLLQRQQGDDAGNGR